MDLLTLHKLILTPFASDAVKLLWQMAALHGRIGKGGGCAPGDFRFPGYAICMVAKLHTLTEGKLLLHLPLDAAIKVGNRIREQLRVEPFDLAVRDENIDEAWMEFANTLVGLSSQRLQQSQAPMAFSLPITVASQRDLGYLMEGVREVLTASIDIEGGGQLRLSFLSHHEPH